MSGMPWDRIYQFAGLRGGQDNYLTVPAPSSGFLNKLVVYQKNGTLGGFTAVLYNSRLAAGANASEPVDAEGVPVSDPAMYEVIAPLTAANNVAVASQYGLQQAYSNQDPGSMGREYRLYLNVHPVNSGDFEVAIAVTVPNSL